MEKTLSIRMDKNMKRCTVCILPEAYPGITFDEKGVCNFCKNYTRITYLGSDRLKADLATARKRKGDYDCVVPISGGKDSTYVLYQITKSYGLKALAFNYDNGVTHPQAQENVRAITKMLGVDLVIKKNEKQKEYLITNLKAYLHKPAVGMIPQFCTGCRYGIIGNAARVAKEYRIPMIIIGWSPIEDTPFKEAYLKEDGRSVKTGVIKNLIKNPYYLKPDNFVASVKDYFHSYQKVRDWNFILKLLHPGIKLIQFYDYIPYNPDEIQRVVEKEVGWKTPDPKNSWQWDCKIKLLQNYFYKKTVNFTATDAFLSAMVREGFITRSEALKRLEYAGQQTDGSLEHLHAFLRELNQDDLIAHFIPK